MQIRKLFIAIVMLILFTPIILLTFGIKVQPTNKSEKKISLNFKRNFPLKEDLFKVYREIKTNLFNTNPIPDRVIEASNGWKFLGNSFSNSFYESKGALVFSKTELETLKIRLSKRQDWLKQKDIKFYIAVAPNKSSYYGEMLPIKQNYKKTKMQQIDSLCKSIGIKYIDLGSKFPKEKTLRLYHKTDTHWNDYGGFFAYKATFEAFNLDFKNTNFKSWELEDLNVETIIEPIGDLNGMLMLDKNEAFIHLNFKLPHEAELLEKELAIPKYYIKDPKEYETRYKTNRNDLKLMVINDSFMGYYSKYLKENFGNSVFIWDYRFNKALIAKESPDILYFEILERDLDTFLIEDYIDEE